MPWFGSLQGQTEGDTTTIFGMVSNPLLYLCYSIYGMFTYNLHLPKISSKCKWIYHTLWSIWDIYSYILMFLAYVNITPLWMYRPNFSPVFWMGRTCASLPWRLWWPKKIADGFPKWPQLSFRDQNVRLVLGPYRGTHVVDFSGWQQATLPSGSS